MSFYALPLTVPPNTPATSPATADLKVFPGLITHVWLQFPKGCAGLLHARVLRTGNQVWPSNANSDLATDGFIIDFPEEYDLTDEPLLLTLSGYNLDDTFPHTVTLWLATIAAEEVREGRQTASMLNRFLRLVGVK